MISASFFVTGAKRMIGANQYIPAFIGGKAHERQNFWCPAESRTKLHASNRNPSGSRLAVRTRKLIHQHNNN